MSTIVALHAHPDDESLLTGGTLAGLSAAGHRVVLVVATSGARGLTGTTRPADRPPRSTEGGLEDGIEGSTGRGTDARVAVSIDLGQRRSAEAEAAARELGCARLVQLGYDDSGWDGTSTPAHAGFATIPVAEAARRVADVLIAESADLLIGYDSHGGYGHPDHLQVHRVAIEAARLAGTPRLLEATIDRTLIARVVRLLHRVRMLPAGTDVTAVDGWYSARAQITHRVPVRASLDAKRRALACHASQASGGRGPRTVSLLLRLPRPLFARAAGVEWFVERDVPVPARPLTDVLQPVIV